MGNRVKKFKKVVILDTVILYPEHRELLEVIAEEILEFPSSLPEGLEKQYEESPELFLNKKCYTQLATDNIPLQLLMNRVDGADVIVSCWTDIPDEILRLNPQLKLILFWTHEKEHRINVQLANELGITVANIPDYGTDSVAEVVFAGLFELITRNFPKQNKNGIENLYYAIMKVLFDKFRFLLANEKYTRAGKFSHHFHKLGLVKFDFTKKNLDELIPERLIAGKRIGFLNIEPLKSLNDILEAFHILHQSYQITDSNLATYYKFLSENDVIFFDSKNLPVQDFTKATSMFADKLVDIQELDSNNYSCNDKIFGIVGLGRIGLEVAIKATALGFKVIYYSQTRKEDWEKQYGIGFATLEELSRMSDVISIHVPAHKAENLFNKKLVESMKKGAMFINTADGNSIDQQALTQRMINGEVYSFLDVYPGLPRKDIIGLPMTDKSDWKLHKELPNNIFAYRAGWKTQESIRVKTYKLLGEMVDYTVGKKDEYVIAKEL